MSHTIAYMWNLKSDTNELMNKTEIDSQKKKKKKNLRLPKGKGGQGSIRIFGLKYTTTIYKIDSQQRPTIYSTANYAQYLIII